MVKTVLSRPVIVAAAVAVIGESGLAGLTMRSLAKRLGVDPTAMYRHFRTKDELLAHVVDDLAPALFSSDDFAVDHHWSSIARQLAWRLRMLLRDQPGLAPLIARGPVSRRIAEVIIQELRVLRAAGMTEFEARFVLRSVVSFTVGFALLEAGSRVEESDDDSASFAAAGDAAHFWRPTTSEFDDHFAAGIDALLAHHGTGA